MDWIVGAMFQAQSFFAKCWPIPSFSASHSDRAASTETLSRMLAGPQARSRRWSSPEPLLHTSDVLSIVSPFAMASNVFTRHTRTSQIRKSMITAFTQTSPETYRLAIWRVPAFDNLPRCPSIGEAGVTMHSCLQERSFAVTLPTRPASQRQLSYL
jgi:hypothetical protein